MYLYDFEILLSTFSSDSASSRPWFLSLITAIRTAAIYRYSVAWSSLLFID